MKPISEDCRRQTQKYTLLQNHGKKSKKPKPIKVFLKTNQRCSEIRPLLHTRNTYTHTQHLFKVKKKS